MGGFFGTISKNDCVKDLYYGTDYHSHLGTRRGGLAVLNAKGFTRSIHNIENTYFRTKFEPGLKEFKGNKGIGIISDNEAQPIIVNSHHGKFAVVTVARITNIKQLEKKALKNNLHFSETGPGGINPSELIAMMINEEETFEKGFIRVFEEIKGSCSILVLTKKGIYAARDKLGRTPVIIGKKKDAIAIASETSCFPNLGYNIKKYLGPGEVVFITADGYNQVVKPGDKMQICSFLWVYYGYPTSNYEGINVEQVRYNCGAALARNDKTEVDFVAGIPDSGIGHAIGYAIEKGIPYKRPCVKYTPTWPRSFMPYNQKDRNLVARMKLIPNSEIIRGKKMAFCDDSIVRGTQLQDNVQILYECGATETHMRVACPPLTYACKFLNFSMSRSSLELASRKAIFKIKGRDAKEEELALYAKTGSKDYKEMVETIRKRLKLTTLKYQTIEDLIAAIGLPKEKLCTHCWDGSGYF